MRLTTSSPSCAESHEIWEPKPPGTLWATPGLLRDSFIFTFHWKLSRLLHWKRVEECGVSTFFTFYLSKLITNLQIVLYYSVPFYITQPLLLVLS